MRNWKRGKKSKKQLGDLTLARVSENAKEVTRGMSDIARERAIFLFTLWYIHINFLIATSKESSATSILQVSKLT